MRTAKKEKLIPYVDDIVTAKGIEIKKCCLSCKFYNTGDDDKVICGKTKMPEDRYNVCSVYRVHPRYDKVGASSEKVKPRGYFKWQIEVIKRFTRGFDTNWKAHGEFMKSLGNTFKYWNDNIKGKENYEDN